MSPVLEELVSGIVVGIYVLTFLVAITHPKVQVWLEDIVEGVSWGLKKVRGLLGRLVHRRSSRARRDIPTPGVLSIEFRADTPKVRDALQRFSEEQARREPWNPKGKHTTGLPSGRFNSPTPRHKR